MVKRRLQSKSIAELDKSQKHRLLRGGEFFGPAFPGGEPEERRAWEAHRQELLSEHIEKNPGTRPHAWWRFEAPEPRQRIRQGPKALGPPTFYGVPAVHDGNAFHLYESQFQYLDRLHLLTESERDVLALIPQEDREVLDVCILQGVKMTN